VNIIQQINMSASNPERSDDYVINKATLINNKKQALQAGWLSSNRMIFVQLLDKESLIVADIGTWNRLWSTSTSYITDYFSSHFHSKNVKILNRDEIENIENLYFSPEEKIKQLLQNSSSQHMREIKTLLEHNPNLISTSCGTTFFDVALENYNQDFMMFLLDKGVDVERMESILEKVIEKNFSNDLIRKVINQCSDQTKMSAFNAAIRYGNFEIAEILIKQKNITFHDKAIISDVMKTNQSPVEKGAFFQLLKQQISHYNWFKEDAQSTLRILLNRNDLNAINKDLLDALLTLSELSVYELLPCVKSVAILELMKEVDENLLQQPLIHKIIKSTPTINENSLNLVKHCLTWNRQLGILGVIDGDKVSQTPLNLAVEKYNERNWEDKDKANLKRLIECLLRNKNPNINQAQINNYFEENLKDLSNNNSAIKKIRLGGSNKKNL
jgi:hypothetical protein